MSGKGSSKSLEGTQEAVLSLSHDEFCRKKEFETHIGIYCRALFTNKLSP